MRTFLTAFLILLINSSFARSIYDHYDHGDKFREFDAVMNESRFPSSDKAAVENWTKKLIYLAEKLSDYPELASAHYFIGSYSFELGDFNTALTNLEKAKQLNPELTKKTPLNSFIEKSEKKLKQTRITKLCSTAIFVWITLIVCLIVLGMKKKVFTKRVITASITGVICGAIALITPLAIDTANSADGLEKFYLPPVLVKSTIFQTENQSLKLLFFYGTVTILVTAIASIASQALKKRQVIFPLLTSVLIGTCCSTIYYQNNCLETNRSGTGFFKRISFPEDPILWHHDVPDEMIDMYDTEMKLLIKEAKEKKRMEK